MELVRLRLSVLPSLSCVRQSARRSLASPSSWLIFDSSTASAAELLGWTYITTDPWLPPPPVVVVTTVQPPDSNSAWPVEIRPEPPQLRLVLVLDDPLSPPPATRTATSVASCCFR